LFISFRFFKDSRIPERDDFAISVMCLRSARVIVPPAAIRVCITALISQIISIFTGGDYFKGSREEAGVEYELTLRREDLSKGAV
jgi:hypothetical protein